jgi:hypothetical protein
LNHWTKLRSVQNPFEQRKEGSEGVFFLSYLISKDI